MRIVLCNTLYPPLGIGGSERSTQFLAEALVGHGHEVTVLTQGTSWRTREEWLRGVKVIRTASPPGYGPNIYAHRSSWDLTLARWFERYKPDRAKIFASLIKRECPDIVNTNVVGQPHSLWRAIKALKIPVVHTIRNHSLMCSLQMFKSGQNCETHCADCCKQFRRRRVDTEHVSGVVGISHYILQRHLTAGYFTTVPLKAVIPNAYICDFAPLNLDPTPATSKLRLGYLGRLHQTKGVAELIRAAAQLPHERLSVTIAGTGNPEYVRYLRSIATENVKFLGFVPTAELFGQIDVLVAPSVWHEPFGRIYIEALAHGVPVLGSTRGAAQEILKDGDVGWLCEPEARSLTEQIRTILEHPPDLAMRRRCLEEANRYLPAHTAHAHSTFFERVLRERSKGRQS